LNLSNTTIARTQKVKLVASLSPSTASNKKITWKSNNPKVAVVSSSGVVTGKAGGTAIITCTARDDSGVSASCIVTVTPIYPTGIKISKTVLQLKPGKTSSLRATISPRNTDFKTAAWASSNPAVTTVDAKGKVKAISPGTAVVTVTTDNGLSASCAVTVP
jgi:alpha-amylase